MKKTNSRRFSRFLSAFLAAALLAAALPGTALAAVPSGGLTGGYFVTGNPPFAYVITGLDSSSTSTVKLYQNQDMQSYETYTGSYAIPERVYNEDELRTYTVTEIGGSRGGALGALENVPLRGVTLPGTIAVIGSRAFAGCASLEEIVFPTSVLDLASDAFTGTQLRKLTLDVTSETSLMSGYSYTPRGKAIPVSLPTQIEDLLVEDLLTIVGQVEIPGKTTLSGGRISLQVGSSLTLDGPLSGAGVVEVANDAVLTLGDAPSGYTGTIRLSGAISRLENLSSAPVTVTDASGKTVVVNPGETRTGGQKDDPASEGPAPALRPQITTNYGGTVAVEEDGKVVVVTAFQGYRVQDVTINGMSMGAITRYEFQEASSQNMVAVTFAQGQDPEGPDQPQIDPVFQFTDVSPTASYADSLRFLVNNGIFQGVSKSSFAPSQTVTRAMMASLFKRMEVYGRDFQVNCAYPCYSEDLPENAWYSADAAWAIATDVIPMKYDLFRPKDKVTREELALCLYRYTHARGYDTVMDVAKLYSYSDIGSLSPLSRRAMAWAVSNGYISAKGGKAFPSALVTRAEISETLARYLKVN